MLKRKDYLQIPIEGQNEKFFLLIHPQSQNALMFEDDNSSIIDARYQLTEGCTYSYEFISNSFKYQFVDEDDVIRFHRFKSRHACEGIISTGIYVGHLKKLVCNIDTNDVQGYIHIEIRSKKADYESDYRVMLGEIAEYYTDLVLQQGAPVTQHLEIDENTTSQTLYQRFSFVKSLIENESFNEAIHKVTSNPIKKWTESYVRCNITNVRKLSRKNLRQIASLNDRIPLPQNYRSLPSYLKSVPRYIDAEYKHDTIDNQENRFIKFVLRTFYMFCLDIKKMENASERLKLEADQTIERIAGYLENQFFRQVSMPTYLNLNSPVLQRKEGYREVFQTWLMFDFAAKLNWIGGDDVYDAGKKNVATLYEYWMFFKLLELISDFFGIETKEKIKLVRTDSDGINLNLVQGKQQMLYGRQKSSSRLINVSFYYNRTFSNISENNDPIHSAGSWTMSMRPDYTLSFWPGEISEKEAEKQDLITHIHFDAKYRLNNILLKDEPDVKRDLSEEKSEQELGIYKRADLLKMHAYKDAIRRTSGAYVLYPGTENNVIKGYHEIIPGLGAFSIRPGHWQNDSIALRQFLAEVKAHMLDRTSEREKMSYYQYDVYKEQNDSMLMECMPESVYENRDFLPDKTSVIIAYYKNEEHLRWILEHHLYNMRSGDDLGAISLDNNIVNARYLLLHNGKFVRPIIRILKGGPKVYTRAQLIKLGYPQYLKRGSKEVDIDKEKNEANRIYLVYKLFKNNKAEDELLKYTWDLKSIIKSGKMVTRSFTENFAKLMRLAKLKDSE